MTLRDLLDENTETAMLTQEERLNEGLRLAEIRKEVEAEFPQVTVQGIDHRKITAGIMNNARFLDQIVEQEIRQLRLEVSDYRSGMEARIDRCKQLQRTIEDYETQVTACHAEIDRLKEQNRKQFETLGIQDAQIAQLKFRIAQIPNWVLNWFS